MGRAEHRLTERQRKLIDYLMERSIKTHVSTLCRDLSEYYTLNESITAHDPCIALRNDIRKINRLTESECFICQDHNYNYWIARTLKDVTDCIGTLQDKALRYWRDYWTMVRKAAKDKQFKTEDFVEILENRIIKEGI